MADKIKTIPSSTVVSDSGNTASRVPEHQQLPSNKYPRSYGPDLTRMLTRSGGGNIDEGERLAMRDSIARGGEAWEKSVESRQNRANTIKKVKRNGQR